MSASFFKPFTELHLSVSVITMEFLQKSGSVGMEMIKGQYPGHRGLDDAMLNELDSLSS